MYKPCECLVAGFCPRYKKNMSEVKWKLCQTNEKYRMLFDEIAGNEDFNLLRKPKIKINKNKKQKKKRKKMGQVTTNIKREKLLKALKAENITEETLNKPSEGVGDTVEKILTRIGITQSLIQNITKGGCGCDKRKKWLNKLLPYAKK